MLQITSICEGEYHAINLSKLDFKCRLSFFIQGDVEL